ncbi:MAG: rod shape-determining protein RodA [Epsilonproteobacteria bacterium]|nr:rod shape-determining protein RodA [Campylobacterota bacterium]
MFTPRRYLRYFDWASFFLMLTILSIGLLFVFSATYTPQKPFSLFFKKQVVGSLIGLGLYAFFSILDLRLFIRWGFWGYFVSMALLLYTFVGGWIGMGAKRWINLYFFRGQPSELIKFFLPAFVAFYFAELEVPKYFVDYQFSFREYLFPLATLALNFVLILKQPDLGTALIVLFSGLALFWFVGLDRRFFLVLALASLVAAPVLWKCLKPYQQKRVLVLLGYGDEKKERYHIEQSKIAIGSGGLMGKGLLKGTQNKLGFLPEDHTDFIFSVMCEEVGFLGALVLIALFCMLIGRIVYIGLYAKLFFEQIVLVGLLMPFMLSVCINIGMVIGLLPVVGIPLPLCTYGISHLWITLASLGIINNIAIRRFYY